MADENKKDTLEERTKQLRKSVGDVDVREESRDTEVRRLHEIYKQKGQGPFIAFMREKLGETNAAIQQALSRGAWNLRRDPEAARKHMDHASEVRREIRTLTIKRLRLMEQQTVEQDKERSPKELALLQESANELLADVDRRIVVEEARQMALYHCLATCEEFLEELGKIPENERAEFIAKWLPGAQKAVRVLEFQTGELQDALGAISVVHEMTQTIGAPRIEFGIEDPEKMRQSVLLRLADDLEKAMKQHEERAAKSDSKRHFKTESPRALVVALREELVKKNPDPPVVLPLVGNARHFLETQLSPHVHHPDENAALFAFDLPKDVTKPLTIAEAGPANINHAMPAADALALGTEIGRHRQLANQQRDLLKKRMDAKDTRTVIDLENDRSALVERYFIESERIIDRRIELFNLLALGETIGAPGLLTPDQVTDLQSTRRYLAKNVDQREILRHVAQQVRERGDQGLPLDTQLGTIKRVLRDAKKANGDKGFLIPDPPNDTLYHPASVLDWLGYASHDLETANTVKVKDEKGKDRVVPVQFHPDIVPTIQKIADVVRQEPELRLAIREKLLALRRIPEDKPDKEKEDERQKILIAVHTLLWNHFKEKKDETYDKFALQTLVLTADIDGKVQTVKAERLEGQHIFALLEVLDLANAPYAHEVVSRETIRQIAAERRRNLDMLITYLEDWEKRVSKGQILLDPDNITQHFLTVKAFDWQALSMSVPKKFEEAKLTETEREGGIWWNPLTYPKAVGDRLSIWQEHFSLTHGLYRISKGKYGYKSSEARIKGGFFGLKVVPDALDALQRCLIPPLEVLKTGDNKKIEAWRKGERNRIEQIGVDAGGGEEGTKAMGKAVSEHFENAEVRARDNVIDIAAKNRKPLTDGAQRLKVVLLAVEDIADEKKQCWTQTELKRYEPSKPADWKDPSLDPAQGKKDVAVVVARCRKPSGKPEEDRNLWQPAEVKWVYARLGELNRELSKEHQEGKVTYMRELSQNFNVFLTQSGQEFKMGTQDANDTALGWLATIEYGLYGAGLLFAYKRWSTRKMRKMQKGVDTANQKLDTILRQQAEDIRLGKEENADLRKAKEAAELELAEKTRLLEEYQAKEKKTAATDAGKTELDLANAGATDLGQTDPGARTTVEVTLGKVTDIDTTLGKLERAAIELETEASTKGEVNLARLQEIDLELQRARSAIDAHPDLKVDANTKQRLGKKLTDIDVKLGKLRK